MIGETVGNYRVTALLGEGGMGVVYAAEHPGIGRRAAVKILHPEMAQNPEVVSRFFNEARAANAVRHRGIVEVFDFGTLPSGASYIVMELLEGESLSARLRRAGSLTPDVARAVGAQAAGALGAAHAAGIVHRDLKPDNLFLCPDYQIRGAEIVKVLDFGIAKLGAGSNQILSVKTRTGAVMGTPTYMSPEQCLGTREVDHRTDIYALGVILYELVCGRPPFVTEGFGEMVHLHISAPPAPPRAHNAAVPADLEAIILRALAKNPSDRFQSMEELQVALTAPGLPSASEMPPALAGYTLKLDPQPSQRPVPATMRFGPPTTFTAAAQEVTASVRPRSSLGWIAGGALLAAVAGGGFWLWRQQNGRGSDGAIAANTGPTPAADEAPSPGMAPQPPPVEAPTITARIGSRPDGARVVRQRDRAVLGVTPLHETWPREDRTETLRLELEGYQSEAIAVPLDRSVNLSLQLKKVEAVATTPLRAPAQSGRHRGGARGRGPVRQPPVQQAPDPEPEAI